MSSKRCEREGVIRFRVRYGECDPMGVVHHASYLPWLEMGRTELLRGTGVSYAAMEAEGIYLVIVGVEARYRRPGRYDDEIEVRTRLVEGGRVKIVHEYEVVRAAPAQASPPEAKAGDVLVTARTTLACVGREGRVRELPPWLMDGA